jgi:hypothetical protein
MKKTYFFGWTNIKRFIMEILKTFSSQPSFFSRKRFEEFFAFIIGQGGMIYFLSININNLSAGDFAIWAGIEFTVSGYVLYQIQKEKKVINTTDTNTSNGTNDNTGENFTNSNTTKTNTTGNN